MNDMSEDSNKASSSFSDGRNPFQWESRYPEIARREILMESIFVFVLFGLSLCLIYLTWNGALSDFLGVADVDKVVFNKYAYYSLSGLLGGVVFGMKYLYRVVARGYWHQDRRAWRLMSPFIAFAIAFIIGTLLDSSMISASQPLLSSSIISIGFLSGYFADEAVGKMYEIASVVFGKSITTKNGDR